MHETFDNVSSFELVELAIRTVLGLEHNSRRDRLPIPRTLNVCERADRNKTVELFCDGGEHCGVLLDRNGFEINEFELLDFNSEVLVGLLCRLGIRRSIKPNFRRLAVLTFDVLSKECIKDGIVSVLSATIRRSA